LQCLQNGLLEPKAQANIKSLIYRTCSLVFNHSLKANPLYIIYTSFLYKSNYVMGFIKLRIDLIERYGTVLRSFDIKGSY
jgi:hypothetical protein